MQTRTKRSVTTFFLVTGVLLLVGSALYLAYSIWRSADRENKTAALEQNLQKGFNKETREEVLKEAQTSGKRILMDEERERKKNAEKQAEATEQMDETSIASAVGVVRIDKIDVLLPIFNDTGEQSLRDGVGLLEETGAPTSQTNSIAVLAGHRGGYNGEDSFLHIDQLTEGDEIKVTTEEEVLYYKVCEQEVIEPTDWSKFTVEKDKSKLFLLSCHPYPINDKRILIKAELSKSYRVK